MIQPTRQRPSTFDLSQYSKGYSSQLRRSPIGSQYTQKPLTQNQMDLLPYLESEVQKQAEKRGLWQPVEMIFNVLSRGQFLSANVVQQLATNIKQGNPLLAEMPEAIKGALSGQVEGDWKTVLFGGETEGGESFEGLTPWDPKTKLGKIGKNAAGFVANVALDPLTYVGFGATTGARAAAGKLRKDATMGFLKKLGRQADEVFPELIQKGFDKKAFLTKLTRSRAEGLDYLTKYATQDITRILKDVGDKAYKIGLRTPAAKITDDLLDDMFNETVSRFGREGTENIMTDLIAKSTSGKGPSKEMTDKFQKLIDTTFGPSRPGVGPDDAIRLGDDTFRPPNKQIGTDFGPSWPSSARGGQAIGPPPTKAGPEVMLKGNAENLLPPGADEVQKLLEYLGTNPYGGAGTRAGRVFRKELNVGERYPRWLKEMDALKKRMGGSKIGGKFSDAWWATLNNPKSPVSQIRNMLHIRNPYQKLLSVMEKDVQGSISNSMITKGERIMDIVEELPDEEKTIVSGAMIWSQMMQEKEHAALKGIKEGVTETFSKPYARPMRADEILSQVVEDPDQLKKLSDVVGQLNEITGEWDQYSRWAADEGFIPEPGFWQDYLPEQRQSRKGFKRSGSALSTDNPPHLRKRKKGWAGNISEQQRKIGWMYGLDDDEIAKVITSGGSDLNVDLQDMMLRRAFAQSRLEQRVTMIQQFKEFGVDVNHIKASDETLYNGLVGKWGDLEPLGMRTIQNETGLEGLLFDKDVGDILERAIRVTSDDKSLADSVKALSWFTSWWRGWATLSPGFHMRNFLSNNMTGYLKHGSEWLDPKSHIESFVATSIGLHGYDEGIKKLSKIFPHETVVEVASRRIGDHTIADLAERAGGVGLISRLTRGFQQPQDYQELVKQEGKLLKNVEFNPGSTNFTPMQASRNLGSYVESQSKFNSFLLDYKRAIGQGTEAEAAWEFAKQEAKKWFIDYSDLSKFERNVMRNVIPFYTWIRGNLANQITGMMQFTDMYSMLPKAEGAIEMEGGPDREDLPEWARELGLVPVGEDGEATRFFWPNFPHQDLNQIPMKFKFGDNGVPIPVAEDPLEMIREIAASAHPLIKSAIQMIPEEGYDVFYREELGDTRRAPRALRVLTKSFTKDRPNGSLGFLDGLLRTIGYREGLRADIDDKGRLVIDSKIGKLLEDNILPLRMLPKYLDLPELLFPVIEDWKKKAFGAVDDHDALEEFFQTLSFWGGVKFRDIEVEDRKFWQMQEALEAAQKEKAKDQRNQPGRQFKTTDWRGQQEALHKRLGL